MSRISIELVPRSADALHNELGALNSRFPQLQTVNIPDLLRFDSRSWDACILAKSFVQHAIPHIRAMDFDLSQRKGIQHVADIAGKLQQSGLDEVLLVTGDMPQDMSKRVYETTVLKLISHFKTAHPQFKVYAAIDSYRSGIRQELQYVKQKREAGADGFFTQPFFDLRLLEIYAEQLSDDEVYWGVSPITSEGSMNYWQTKNHVVLPAHFTPTMEWNTTFAQQVLRFIEHNNKFNAYFMPIRADIIEYLGGIFSSD